MLVGNLQAARRSIIRKTNSLEQPRIIHQIRPRQRRGRGNFGSQSQMAVVLENGPIPYESDLISIMGCSPIWFINNAALNKCPNR